VIVSGYLKFDNLLNDLDHIIQGHQKQAYDMDDGKALKGDMTTLKAEGEPVPKAKEKEDSVDVRAGEPSGTDPLQKSVKENDPADGNAKDAKKVENEIDKQSAAGNKLLHQIKELLKSAEEGEMDYSEGEKKEKCVCGKAVDKAMVEADVEAELSPEDEKVLEEYGVGKTAEARAAYLLAKQAGVDFDKLYGEEIMKVAMHRLIESGEIEKLASYRAGQMFAELEAKGEIAGPGLMKKAGHELGTVVNSIPALQKQAYDKGVQDVIALIEERKGIVKQASASAAEEVIAELARRAQGQGVNQHYGSLVNP
jgi:hypothetical protein